MRPAWRASPDDCYYCYYLTVTTLCPITTVLLLPLFALLPWLVRDTQTRRGLVLVGPGWQTNETAAVVADT